MSEIVRNNFVRTELAIANLNPGLWCNIGASLFAHSQLAFYTHKCIDDNKLFPRENEQRIDVEL
jgi:hypothetical protein